MRVTGCFGFMIKKWQIGDQIHDHNRGELGDHPKASRIASWGASFSSSSSNPSERSVVVLESLNAHIRQSAYGKVLGRGLNVNPPAKTAVHPNRPSAMILKPRNCVSRGANCPELALFSWSCRAPWTGSIGTRSSCAGIWGMPFSSSSGSRVRDCLWEA